ncbi:MAG: hypothetical protein ACU836_18695 [Gammaproteobacteria bacterium]
MKKLAILMLMLTACNSETLQDGYQVGDGLSMAADGMQRLQAAIDTYCGSVASDAARKAALAIIRIRYPTVPENGICAGLPEDDR